MFLVTFGDTCDRALKPHHHRTDTSGITNLFVGAIIMVDVVIHSSVIPLTILYVLPLMVPAVEGGTETIEVYMTYRL